MPMKSRFLSTALALAAVLALGACGPKLIRGQSPYVTIRGIDVTGEQTELQLHVQNVNGIAMELTRVQFTLDLDEKPLARYDRPAKNNIIANGTETLRFELDASDTGLASLATLDNREAPNLPYTIKGELTTANDGILSFSGEGRIYPVPGRPGQFR